MEICRWAVRERDPKVVRSFAGKEQGTECKYVHCRWVGGLKEGRFKILGNYPPTPSQPNILPLVRSY